MGSQRNNRSFTTTIIGAFILFIFIYIFSHFPQFLTLKPGNAEDRGIPCLSPLSEEEIFSSSKVVGQNDCRLLNHIRKNYLIEPSNKPYNLVHPESDPNDSEGQHKYVLEILNHMKNGFFVECGAFDGEILSASLRLELDYGWTGLLVEPNRKSFADLQKKNRKAWAANLCLSPANHPQMMSFIEVHDRVSSWHPALSALEKYKTGHHIKNGSAGTIVQKPCFPTFSVLSALNVVTVDFFLLDIEGAELDVLKTIPFDEILIKVFSVEWNHIPEGKEELLRFMLSKGYRLAKDLKRGSTSDFILVHESVPIPTKFQNAVMTPDE